jgi:FkbM family methyltransferase
MNKKLNNAFSLISKKNDWRKSFIKHIKNFENEISTLGVDVREEITGPLIDAIFDENQIIQKKLIDGTMFEFLYRTKIARDFVMSEPEVPNHAWEPQTSRLLVVLSQKAQTVVVGGAYFGDHTILIAKEIAKSKGVIHAFEPNKAQFNMLLNNVNLNNLNNVIQKNIGLWDNNETNLSLIGYDSFAYPEPVIEISADSFPTITIDEYFNNIGIKSLDLIMLDIEGAELRALKGAINFLKQTVERAPNIVFEVHSHFVDWSNGLENTEIITFLTQLGYHIFAIRDFNSNYDMSFKKIEIIPLNNIYLEGPEHGFNMLAVKDLSIINNTIFKICRDVSPKLLRHKNPALHHPTDGL